MKVSVYQTFDGRGRILGSTPVRRLLHSITMILQFRPFFDSGHAFTETREKPNWMKETRWTSGKGLWRARSADDHLVGTGLIPE